MSDKSYHQVISSLHNSCHDGTEVRASGLKIGRSPVQISPKTNFPIMIKLPELNQLGSKAASDSTLKQMTTCGVSNTCTLLFRDDFATRNLAKNINFLPMGNGKYQVHYVQNNLREKSEMDSRRSTFPGL